MFGKGDISFHGKWQQVDASIHASQNFLDYEVTVVSAQVVKDDGNGARVLIIKVAQPHGIGRLNANDLALLFCHPRITDICGSRSHHGRFRPPLV